MKKKLLNQIVDRLMVGQLASLKILAGLFVLVAVLPAQAANDTWNGAAGDATFNWTNKNNWVGAVAPVASDSLFFDGTTGLVNSNGFAAATIFTITFNNGAGAFTLVGNSVNARNITNASGILQTIGLSLPISAGNTWDVGSGGLQVTNASGNTVTKVGSGTLYLLGGADNGSFNVNANAGTVLVGKIATANNNIHAINTLVINNGIVKYDPNYVVNTANVYPNIGNFGGQINGTITLNAGGTLDLNGCSGNNAIIRNSPIGTGGIITNSSTSPATVTLNNQAAGIYIWPGNVGDNAANGGTLAMQVENGGATSETNVWPGNLNFNGGFNVNRGTEVLNGSFTGVGLTSMGNGSGSGVIIVNSTFNDVGGITMNSGTGTRGQFIVNNGGSVSGGGTITVNGGETFVVSSGGSVADGAMNLTGTLLGTGTNNAITTVNSGGNIQPGAVNTAGTLTTSNLTDNGTLTFDLAGATTIGGGVNDLLVVNGNLDGGGTVTINPIGALVVGTPYTIIQYTGSYTPGTLNPTVVNSSRYAITMDDTDTVGKTIKVTATGSSASLAWNALIGGNNTWNIGTGGNANWTNLTSAMASDFFYSGDSVNFDDNTPGVTNIITIGAGLAVVPTVITNNAGTNNYVINGPGKISGAAALVKQGTNLLTINSVNDFTGPVSVQNGTLALNSGALSSGGKNAVTVSSPGTLSLGSTNVGNGAVITIDSLAGNGTVDYLRTNSGFSAITFSVGNNGGSGVFSGTITNSKIFNSGTAATSFTNTIALIKTGTGTETFSGTNTYAGQTTINGGGVLVAAAISDTAGASSISTNTVNLNNGTLEYSGAASVTTVRPIAGTSGTTNGLQVDNAGATLTVLGVVNNMTLKKLGAGTLSFGGANNNNSLTMDVQAGSLILNKTNAGNQIAGIANVSGSATVQLAGNNNDQIFDSGSVANMNGTFDLNGRNETIQALSGGGTVRNGAGSTTSILTLGSNNGSGNFLGTIANGVGTVALTKTGNGTATLTTNTYTGSTTITGGTLALNAGGSLASSSISLAGGTKLDVSAAGGLALSGSQTLSGSGVVTGSVSTASGTVLTVAALGTAGTLSFSNNLALTSSVLNFDLTTNVVAGGGTNDLIQLAGGTLTLSGVTTVNVSGSLATGNYTLIQGASSISGGPANFALGTTLRQAVSFDTTTVPGSVLLVVGAGTPASLVWSGTNGSVWNVQTTINWLNGGIADLFFNSDNVVFDDTSTNGTVNISGTVNPSSTYVTNNSRAYTIGGGVIGSGTVTKDGPGSLTLNGANTYGSVTTVKGGTLVLGNNSALGTTVAGTTATNGGTLDLNAFSPAGEQVSVAGTGVGGNGALVNNGASASSIGTLTLTADATVGGGANISSSDFTTTASALTKIGANTLTLNSGATRGVGVLVVNQGAVSNAASALQVTTTNASGQAIVMKGGTALNGTQVQLTRTNGTTIKFDGTGGVAGATISAPLQLNNINLAGSNTVDVVDVDHIVGVTNELTLNGVISQSGAGTTSITKAGAGTLVLGAANTYGGNTRITNGVLRLANTNALQNSTLDLNAADVGALDFGALTNATFAGLIGTRSLGLTNASAAPVALTIGNNNVSSVSSNVISGAGSLIKTGNGVLQLLGTNTYTGKTFISAGTLQVAADNNLGAAPGTFVADQLTLNGGTLAVTNSTSFATTRGLTVGGGAISVGTGVNLVWGGPITGTGLTSSGLGTLILAGTNTYTTTAINNGGTLQVGNGGTSGTLGLGTVSISGGSTLAFNRSDAIVVTNNVTGGQMVFNSGIVTFANTVDNNSTVATVNTNATLILNAPGGGHVVGGGNIALTLNGGTAVLGPSGGDQIFNQKGVQMNNGTFDVAGTNETIGGLIGYGSLTNSQSGSNPNATLSLAINNSGTPGRDGSADVTGGNLSINGCILNVAGNATVEAGAGLSGNATIQILYQATLNNYGLMSPGNGNTTGTLLISNAVSCNLLNQPGSTNVMKLNKAAGTNDQVVVIGNITFDGTLIVTNVGGNFVGGESYQLFVGSIGGTFATVVLPALPSGLTWDTSALDTTGTITVSGSVPSHPSIGSANVSGSNLILSGTGGAAGAPYYVLSSTNLALPRASWTPVQTNNFDGSGNFSAILPLSRSEPQRFYLLQIP